MPCPARRVRRSPHSSHTPPRPRRTSSRGDYVETFDLRRRCCPYLTYYAFGDTRKRGMALLRFTHAYRANGFALASEELPDHLAVVCEFAAALPRARTAAAAREPGRRRTTASRAERGGLAVRGRGRRRARRASRAGPARPREGARTRPHRAACRGGRARAVRAARLQVRADENPAVGHRRVRRDRDVRGWARVALPLRQVRLDDTIEPALREPPAAPGQPAVPLRHPARGSRARRRHPDSRVRDGRGRNLRAHVPRRSGHPRHHLGCHDADRHRDPHLPARTTGPVFSATTRNDKAMYVLLVATLVAVSRRPFSAI